jgi:hypothetical protein
MPIPFAVGVWHGADRDGGQDSNGPVRQAPSRSLRPTGRCRVSDLSRADGSLSRRPEGVSRYSLGQTRPGHSPAPFHRPHQADGSATLILAAGYRASITHAIIGMVGRPQRVFLCEALTAARGRIRSPAPPLMRRPHDHPNAFQLRCTVLGSTLSERKRGVQTCLCGLKVGVHRRPLYS